MSVKYALTPANELDHIDKLPESMSCDMVIVGYGPVGMISGGAARATRIEGNRGGAFPDSLCAGTRRSL